MAGRQGKFEQPDFSSEDFYSDVAAALEQALEREPQRQDLRYKLLEIHAAQGRRDAFVSTAHEYRRQLRGGGHGDWEKVVALGRALFVDKRHIDGGSGKTAAGEGTQKRLGDRPGDESINDALAALAKHYAKLHRDADFLAEFDRRVALLTGHPPAPPYHAARLSEANGGARIFLAREEPHEVLTQKFTNALGQGLVARKLGRRRLVAGSTSGLNGVATAMAAAHLELECTIYMRPQEARAHGARLRQMRMLGAEVRTLPEDRKTPFIRNEAQYAEVLNAVRDAALQDWLESPDTSQFVNGLAAGPEPFPSMLQDFHAGTGRAVRQHLVAECGKLPAAVVAVLDGSLDPLYFFHSFMAYRSIRLVGVESELMRDHQRRRKNLPQHGYTTLFSENQVAAADVILHAQGFPSTRREHAWLRETGRVDYTEVHAEQADKAARALARNEGLLITELSAHALARAMRVAARRDAGDAVVALIEQSSESEPTGLTAQSGTGTLQRGG